MAKNRKKSSLRRKNQRSRQALRYLTWTMWNDDIALTIKAINVYIDEQTRVKVNKEKEQEGIERTSRLRRILIKLSERQNHRCCYCGVDTWHPNIHDGMSTHEPLARATLEHVISRSEGGTNKQSNLVMACEECNSVRGDLPVEEFMLIIHGKSDDVEDKSPVPKKENKEKEERRRGRLTVHLLVACTFFPKEYQELMENLSEKDVNRHMKIHQKRRKKSLNRIRRRVARNPIALVV